MTHITNINEVTPADAGLEYADPDYTEYCTCEDPAPSMTPPVVCLRCNRYMDPRQIIEKDGQYIVKLSFPCVKCQGLGWHTDDGTNCDDCNTTGRQYPGIA